MFDRYIGIDYSGAEAPVSRLRALQVYACEPGTDARPVAPYDRGAKNWCRKEIARYLYEALRGPQAILVGLDHGFSLPADYFARNGLDCWDTFLFHFAAHWPMDRDHMYVDFARREEPPGGAANELRLCEQWTASAKSVFHFDVQGSVAKSTHAGIPWLKWLRKQPGLRSRTCFWPFDGFHVDEGRSVVAEVYPSLFRRRYPRGDRTNDQHDAYAVASWLRDMDARGALADYFNPPLTLPERRQAKLEGWILGVR